MLVAVLATAFPYNPVTEKLFLLPTAAPLKIWEVPLKRTKPAPESVALKEMWANTKILFDADDGVIFAHQIEPSPSWSVPGISVNDVALLEYASSLDEDTVCIIEPTGNCWSTTNFEFTAPVAGTYSINWGVTFQDPDAARYVASRVFKGGSQIGSYHRVYHPVEESEQAGNDYGGVDHNIILTFTASEKFHVIFQPSSTLTLAAEEGTYVSGFLIG